LRVACAARGGCPTSPLTRGGRGGRRPAGQPSLRTVTEAAGRHRIADAFSETTASGQTDHGGRNSTAGPRLPQPHVPGIAGWCCHLWLLIHSPPGCGRRRGATPPPRSDRNSESGAP
jgi:hypothetical protein